MARDSLKCRFSYLEWEGWVDQGLICTENVVGILEKIHESLAQCLNILDREGLSLEYDPLYDIYTRIARLREDYNNNWLYGCELANQVEKELDMPYYNAYVNGATEVISNIHMQNITTKNTLGLKDYDGREIDKLTLAAFLGLRDDEGVPSMSRQVVEEKQYYVEEFATLFAELYSDYQIDETGAELEEFLESLYEQGSFSHDIDDKELALWETVLSFSIIVPMIEAFTGEEMLTGNELSDFERIFSGAGAVVDIVGLGMTIKAVRRWWKLRKVDDVVDAANVHHLVGTGYADDVVEGGLDTSFTWKLRGEDVILNDVKVQEISYVKRSSTELKILRNEFDTTTRKAFLEDLGKNAEYLRNAGFSETDILKIQNGRVPDGWQVHHKLPLDDSGTNSFDNLVLIQNEPYHKVITNYQNNIARQMEIGEAQEVQWPIPNGNIYPEQH